MAENHETRSEFGAVAIVLVVAAVGIAVFAGIWLGIVAAIIVTVGFALVAIAALVVWSSRRDRLGEAPQVTPIEDERYRILVIADEKSATPGVADELRSHAGDRPVSVFIVAPALESRLGRIASDQKGYDDATQRLGDLRGALERAGFETQGEVGPSDPLQAADDGLRRFAANEVVFITNPDGESNWLETGVVAKAESRYSQPVKHITATGG
jgi:hypothetical protein